MSEFLNKWELKQSNGMAVDINPQSIADAIKSEGNEFFKRSGDDCS